MQLVENEKAFFYFLCRREQRIYQEEFCVVQINIQFLKISLIIIYFLDKLPDGNRYIVLGIGAKQSDSVLVFIECLEDSNVSTS